MAEPLLFVPLFSPSFPLLHPTRGTERKLFFEILVEDIAANWCLLWPELLLVDGSDTASPNENEPAASLHSHIHQIAVVHSEATDFLGDSSPDL